MKVNHKIYFQTEKSLEAKYDIHVKLWDICATYPKRIKGLEFKDYGCMVLKKMLGKVKENK